MRARRADRLRVKGKFGRIDAERELEAVPLPWYRPGNEMRGAESGVRFSYPPDACECAVTHNGGTPAPTAQGSRTGMAA